MPVIHPDRPSLFETGGCRYLLAGLYNVTTGRGRIESGIQPAVSKRGAVTDSHAQQRQFRLDPPPFRFPRNGQGQDENLAPADRTLPFSVAYMQAFDSAWKPQGPQNMLPIGPGVLVHVHLDSANNGGLHPLVPSMKVTPSPYAGPSSLLDAIPGGIIEAMPVSMQGQTCARVCCLVIPPCGA